MLPISLERLASWMGTSSPSMHLIRKVVIDSRKADVESLFFALPGAKDNGHKYVEQVLDAGGAVVVQQSGWEDQDRVVRVGDTTEALQVLAREYLAWHNPVVVGITGSNGKTTTKDLTSAVLTGDFETAKTQGNLNNELGVPLTILSLEDQQDAIVLEMGMRGLGQIRQLCRIAPLDRAIITNIGPVHLEILGSMDAIAEAKGEILGGLKPNGRAILNADDQRVRQQWQLNPRDVLWTSTFQEQFDIYASQIHMDDRGRAHFTVHVDGQEATVELSIPGRHNVANSLLAIGVGYSMGVPLHRIVDRLSSAQISGMRMEVLRSEAGLWVINDAYNASPASMTSALETAASLPISGKRLAVLGDMLELGEVSPAAHQTLGQEAARIFDEIAFVGRFGGFFREGLLQERFPMDRFLWVNQVQDIQDWVTGQNADNNLLLIKASRGVGLELLLNNLEGLDRSHE